MNQTETRNHKVKCHYGLPEYYKHYKKTVKDPEPKDVFSNVFKDYLLANKRAISNFGYIYVFPQRMGRIELRKIKREVSIDKDGKIKNNLLVNWKKTMKLWEEDPVAKDKKILIRYTNEHTQGYVFLLFYMKNTANYKNKSIYKMQLNREMRRSIAPAIINKRMDAFLLN